MEPVSVLVAQAEMTTDEHYKFYHAYMTEHVGLVAWGRIGTAGQQQWVTPEEANHRWEAKLRKGYHQVSLETITVYPGDRVDDPNLAEVITQHLSGPIAASRIVAREKGTKYRVIAPGCFITFMKHDGGSSFRGGQVNLQVGDVITFLGYHQGFGDSPSIANFGDANGQSYGIDAEFYPGSWGSPDWSRLEEITTASHRAADRIAGMGGWEADDIRESVIDQLQQMGQSDSDAKDLWSAYADSVYDDVEDGLSAYEIAEGILLSEDIVPGSMARRKQAADRITDGETGYPDAWVADYAGHPCPVCGGSGWLEDEDELAWIGCDNCGRTGVEPDGAETNWYQISPSGIPLAASRSSMRRQSSANWSQIDGPIYGFNSEVWAQRYIGEDVPFELSVDTGTGQMLFISQSGNDEIDVHVDELTYSDIAPLGMALLDYLDQNILYRDRDQWVAPIKAYGD